MLLVQNTQLRSQLSDALASKKQLEARLREYETNAPGVQRQESRGSANSGRSSEVTAVDPAGLRDLDQAVGSLSIGAEGQTKYYGETASSDHLGFLLQVRFFSVLAVRTNSVRCILSLIYRRCRLRRARFLLDLSMPANLRTSLPTFLCKS